MAGKFPNMKGHVIVCGFGRVGMEAVKILEEKEIPFIVIDSELSVTERVKELGYKVINGDATRTKILRDASIETAKAIAIAMDNDAKNLFCVLAARDISKNIFIATRANDDFAKEKLAEAGANYIATPQKTASKEIVKELFKP
jgi:voltage-gated potassium channel